MKPGAADGKVVLARVMRSAPTDAEAILWTALRGRRLFGWKFRRQHVIAGYIVDFYCAELWLAVEVDGPVHDRQRDRDEQRDADLKALGVRLLRVRNVDIIERVDSVLHALAERCASIAEDIARRARG